ncbi:PAS domain-containing sensor histidine kinase [Mucilaginibacter sp. CSA2-8R]|uniref:sensor histidine kinase n=1 Tax=Mucilaginibacter sp. CSA2-8R TaxID=3141542 RepID=UPI00315D20F1
MNTTTNELNKIFTFSLDLICVIDANGRFVRVSDAVQPLLGYHPDELTGEPFIDFVCVGDAEGSQDVLKRVLQGKTVVKYANNCRRKDGTEAPMLWSFNFDKEDQLIYVTARDGKDRQQSAKLRESLEASNLRYEYVTKATSDAIWDWDLNKNTLFWGDGFKSIFGHSLAHARTDVGTWTDFIHPDDASDVVSSIWEVIESKQTVWKKEYRFRRGDGSYADVVDRGFVIRNDLGKAIRMVGAQHDISQRNKTLAELKQLASDLYKRNRELQQFGYIVSHNLRSPVANIIGLVDMLEEDKSDPTAIDFCIEHLKVSMNSLDEVITDLSEILSITDGSTEIHKENVDVVEIIEKVVTVLSDQIAQTQANIIVPKGPLVWLTHRAYMYSIFLNLISNAIKYRSEQAPIIKIDFLVTDNTLRITVADNGIGIDTGRHEGDLFKPYRRFTATKSGKGLGLFLVKSHIEVLHGTISLESVPGHGSTFKIAFPADVSVEASS